MYYNPYWNKALQSQARAQSKPQTQQQKQQPKQQDFGGFDSLLVGRECLIKLGCGEVIKGTVSAASKFWYLVNAGGQVMVVNKAYVVMVTPIQNATNNTNNNAAGGANGGEQTSRSK